LCSQNEPWGATWGSGNVTTDFDSFCERFMLDVDSYLPGYKGLFLVEGIYEGAYGKPPSQYPQW
jgi:hypothetical protein